MSLLSTVYQNPGLRHLGDIDLSIRKEDYPEVREHLESADWSKVLDDTHLFNLARTTDRFSYPLSKPPTFGNAETHVLFGPYPALSSSFSDTT